jgi:hypothetical protein
MELLITLVADGEAANGCWSNSTGLSESNVCELSSSGQRRNRVL